MANGGNTVPRIEKSEHIGPDDTGDNIHAKRVANYSWDGSSWQRAATPFINADYDYVAMTNPDGNGNYQTFTYKSGGSSGTVVRTVTYTYDGSSNVTSIMRS